MVPGLVDCHTHLAFGGWRADEFEQRIAGGATWRSREAGGGIASTVRQTRAPPARRPARARAAVPGGDARARRDHRRVQERLRAGSRDELKLLRVYRALRRRQPVRIVPTFLGAHVVPPEFRGPRGRLRGPAGWNRSSRAVAREGLAGLLRCVRGGARRSPRREARRDSARRADGRPRRQAARRPAERRRRGGAGGRGRALSAPITWSTSRSAGIAAMARAGVVAVSLPHRVTVPGPAAAAGAAADRGRACRSRWPPTSTPAPPPATTCRWR